MAEKPGQVTVGSMGKAADESSEDFKEYLRIEAEILLLVEKLETRRGGESPCGPECTVGDVAKSAYETIGKAQAAAAGVLPIWDTDWDLYTTLESLRRADERCDKDCKSRGMGPPATGG